MISACNKLPLFVDGELPATEAQKFTRHLASCPRCPLALSEMLVLDDLVAAAGSALVHPHALRAVPEPSGPADTANHPAALPVTPDRSRGRFRYSFRPAFAALSLALAGATALFVLKPRTEPQADSLLAALAATPYRSQQARLSHPAGDRHRPFNPLRSGGALHPTGTPASVETLAAIERQGDARALATGYFLLGMAAQAGAHLSSGEESADLLNDRAAVFLEQGQIDRADPLLDRALSLKPGHRQARWNRALVLRARGDRAAAARAFLDLAHDEEAGWAEDARGHARDLLP